MMMLPPAVRIYLARGPTDLRRSFDGLAAITRNVLQHNPLSGHLFVFCNRRRDRIRILFWDRTGYWVFAKRLQKGTFTWPEPKSTVRSIEVDHEELMLLLGGIDLRVTTKRRWYGRAQKRVRQSRRSG